MHLKSIFMIGCFALAFISCEWNSSSSDHDMHQMDGMNHNHAHDMDSVAGLVPAGSNLNKLELLGRGKKIYDAICSQCHQADAKGIPKSIPPLANSDFLMADKNRSIEIVLAGISGPIQVNGLNFNNVMPAIKGSDDNVAAVLTYVRNNFNGAVDSISPAEVAGIRQVLGTKP